MCSALFIIPRRDEIERWSCLFKEIDIMLCFFFPFGTIGIIKAAICNRVALNRRKCCLKEVWSYIFNFLFLFFAVKVKMKFTIHIILAHYFNCMRILSYMYTHIHTHIFSDNLHVSVNVSLSWDTAIIRQLLNVKSTFWKIPTEKVLAG